VGILIGIASVLLIFIVHRRFRSFFRKPKEKTDEFGEPSLDSSGQASAKSIKKDEKSQ